MFYVSYKFSSLNAEQTIEFTNEDEAYTEALELLKQGYIVQVNEE